MREKQSLEEQLAQYPEIRERVEALLAIVQGEGEEVRRADEVEERVDEQVRGLGREVIQSWGQRQAGQQERAWSGRRGVTRKEKKSCGG